MRTLKLAITIFLFLCIAYPLTNMLTSKSAAENIGMAVEFNDHSAAAWISLKKGFFEEVGLNISSLASFRTGIALAAALNKDNIQAAWICLGPALVAIDRGVPVEVVSLTHLHGYAVLVRPGSGVKKISDLKEKTVAVPGPGSPTWLLLRIVMERCNLSEDEIQIKKMPPDMGVNALLLGLVDAAALPEPYVSIAESKGARILVRSQDIWPNMPGSVLIVKKSFLSRHPGAVEKLVKANMVGVKFIREHFNEAASIVAESLGIEEPVVRRSMHFLSYDWKVNLSEVERYVDLLRKYGAIKGDFELNEIVNLSFIEKAEGNG